MSISYDDPMMTVPGPEPITMRLFPDNPAGRQAAGCPLPIGPFFEAMNQFICEYPGGLFATAAFSNGALARIWQTGFTQVQLNNPRGYSCERVSPEAASIACMLYALDQLASESLTEGNEDRLEAVSAQYHLLRQAGLAHSESDAIFRCLN